ncbi:MAG: hypothetical protein QXX79_05795 [Candidatus Bathyarchaeia archaeon]
MKTIHKNWRELLNDCILLTFAFGTIGIALKFTTFFDKWVYFPQFPNIFDAVFLILSAVYLGWRSKSKPNRQHQQFLNDGNRITG